MKPLIISLICGLVGVSATTVEVFDDKASSSKSSEPESAAAETVKDKRYAVHDSPSYSHSPTPCPPFFPHYHAPMPEVHYPKPVYGPPVHPKPVYGPAIHPKPVYLPEYHHKPVYKVPEYHPKPVYGPPIHHHQPVQLIHQPVYQSYVPKQTVSYIKPHVSKPEYHYLPAKPHYEKPHFAYAPSYHPMKHEYHHEYNIHQTYHTPSHYVSKPGIVYKEPVDDCKPCHEHHHEAYHHHQPQIIHAPPVYAKPQVHYLPTHPQVSPIIKPLVHHAPCP
ncbi:repetitive proline-rich cell wall protein 1-like isoform X1 [Cotesia glomerata]|uniref:repetitive proline-rich cell wall protein 1-like isoform X1 n=1 Tax=Cotesia glomerata TaxID=32391 RepID=UPI001D0126EE|nr:repetitive proline-rich cell wall protein 1-like isoform X1 [Cotesia glomerata]